MSYFYENEFSNVGRSVHSLAVTATNRFEETRDLVKKFINAKHREEIIFTKGATEGINLVANSFGEKFIQAGDEIILTELEHHSNYVPWHYLRNKKKAVIKFAKINENLEIQVDEIKKLILEREEARKDKDWQKSDKIRDLLLEKGIILEDTSSGTIWKFK